jgi:hypothetical protein
MIWDLPAIAGFAEAGGWRREALVEAVAVAVAASGGDDALVDEVPTGAGPVTVGLWQVPADGGVGFDEESLLRPALNAAAAHRLYVDAGNTWTWSTWWGAPGWDRYMADAKAAVASGRRRQTASEIGPVDQIRQSAGRAAQTARLSASRLAGLADVIRRNTPY